MSSAGQSPAGDLFRGYNERLAERAASLVRGAKALVVVGPPRSGKTFFIENVLKREIQGLKVETVQEFTLGLSRGRGGPKASGSGAEMAEALREIWKGLLGRVSGRKTVIDELKRSGFTAEEVELLKDILPDRVPEAVIRELKELRERYGVVIPYRVPWEVEVKEEGVGEAVKLIKKYFSEEAGNLPIRWLGREYIPPGLVKEVVEKINEGDSKTAEDFVKEQAEAYAKAVRLLVGDEDYELEGPLIRRVKEIVRDLSKDGLSSLIQTVIGGLPGVAVSLAVSALILAMTYRRGDKESLKDLIDLTAVWKELSDALKEVVASKVAVQLGITPEEALEGINGLLGADEEELRQTVADLLNKVEDLTKRMEDVERRQGVLRGPEGLNVVFVGDEAFIRPVRNRPNVKFRFVDPAKFGSLKAKVEELKRKVKEVIERGQGVVVVYGPHGIGKSTLVRYILAKSLRDGEIRAVVDLSSKGVNEIRDVLYSIKELNYVILYDPSYLEVYEAADQGSPMDRVRSGIVEAVSELTKTYQGEVEPWPIIVVVPKAVYDALDEEIKRRVERVELSLSDRDFLKEVIKSYSGCPLDEKTLNDLVAEVLKSNEGYTLIARLIGEGLKRKGCDVSKVEDLLRESRGRADLFMVWWINDYLKIKEDNEINTQRVEAFSEILAVREPFKRGVESGKYVMPPYFVYRLARWSKGLGLGGEEENWGEIAHWLALKHEDLLENAISLIVKAVRGEEIEDERLRKAMSVWRDQGKRVSVNSAEEAVKYVFKEYGGEIKEVIAGKRGLVDPNSPCWNALVFILAAARGRHELQLLLEAYKGMSDEQKRDLAEPVRRALDFLSDPESECRALDMLLADGELTPLSLGLLALPYSAEEFVDNPFIDVMVQRDRMKGELEALLKKWEERHGARLLEEIYGLGLSILSAYAKVDFADEALRVASLSIRTVTRPNLIVHAVDLLSSLREKSPERWAEFISSAISAVANNGEALLDIRRFVVDSLEDLDKLRDPSKVRLIYTITSLIGGRAVTPDEVCIAANLLLKVAEGLSSELLRHASEARVLGSLAYVGLDCGIDIAREIDRLISDLDRAEKFDEWLKDENVREFLKGVSLERPEDALVSHVKNIMEFLHSAAGAISLREGKFDDAVKHFEKARALAQETEAWENYVISHSLLVRAKALETDSLQGLIEAAREFREVFSEAKEKLWIDASSRQLKGSSLANYLVYLGLSGDKGEAERLLREHGLLLDYLPLDERVATTQLLNYLGVVNRRPGVDEVLVATGVYRFLAPALKVSLGLDVDCAKECEKLYEGEPDEKATLCEHVCNGLRLALRGNKFAREMLVEDLKSVSKGSVVEELSKEFSPRAVIQALSTDRSVGDLILTLNALLDGDRETVRAISKKAELAPSRLYSTLFKALSEALEKDDEERVKLALAKLYYFHF